jgi:hypothetical protein
MDIELATNDDAALVVGIAEQATEDTETLRVLFLAGCSRREAKALLLAEVN